MKVASYRTFWVFIILYALLMILASGSIKAMLSAADDSFSPFSFPKIWPNLAYIASYLNLVVGVLIIMLIANEFSFKTFRQNVIDGLSREQAVLAKFLMILVISLAGVVFVLIYGLIRGLSHGEFDHIGHIFEQAGYLLRLFIQMAGYMAIAALLAFLIKKAALAIVAFLLYALVVERLVRLRTPDNIDKFFPMNAMGELIPFPGNIQLDMAAGDAASLSPEMAVALTVGYFLLCLGGSILLMNRSNL